MCLYPRLIKNPKYKPNAKNGGNVPIPTDERVLYVPVGCGKCMECKKQKAREWQVRLNEEIKHDHTAKFVTLTFSEDTLKELCEELEMKESNYIAKVAVRRFLERWRKKYKKSVKHWLVTELGHENTERIHLHGFIFTEEPNEEITNIWKYGNTYFGTWVNAQTINYVVKYINKVDNVHKGFQSQVFCSAGIGKSYFTSMNATRARYKGKDTQDTYILPNGAEMAQPIYYRNKIYTDEQREKLWLHKLDKQERWVDGVKVDVSNGLEYYEKVREVARRKNALLGYGDDSKKWDKKAYNVTAGKIAKLTKKAQQKAKKGENIKDFIDFFKENLED